MAALEHSSAQNLGLAERPLCRRPPDRFGSVSAAHMLGDGYYSKTLSTTQYPASHHTTKGCY